jgi:hypothetical protein
VDTSFNFINNEQQKKSKIYLKKSHYEVLLLLNFGQEADYKRLFLSKLQTNTTKPKQRKQRIVTLAKSSIYKQKIFFNK